MSKFIFLVLFLPCIAYSQQKDTGYVKVLLQQSEIYFNENKFDSSRMLVLQAEALSISLHYPKGEASAALKASAVFRLLQQPEKGQLYLKKALALFTKLDDKEMIAEAWVESADYFPPDTDEGVTQKIQSNEKAVPLFEQAGNIKRLGDVEKVIGDHYADLGRYPEGWVHLNRALNAYQRIGYNKSLQELYDLLGVVATMMGDFQEGLRYGLLAVKTAKENNDTSLTLCTIYNRVGITYVKVSDYNEAYRYYKLALVIAEKYNHEASIKYVIDNIVNVSPKVGKLKEGLAMQQELERRFPAIKTEDKIFRQSTFLTLYREIKITRWHNNIVIVCLPCQRLLKRMRTCNTMYIKTSYGFILHQSNTVRRTNILISTKYLAGNVMPCRM